MFAYIVRRLLWAVVLLIVLSMVTFAIFFLIPETISSLSDSAKLLSLLSVFFSVDV